MRFSNSASILLVALLSISYLDHVSGDSCSLASICNGSSQEQYMKQKNVENAVQKIIGKFSGRENHKNVPYILKCMDPRRTNPKRTNNGQRFQQVCIPKPLLQKAVLLIGAPVVVLVWLFILSSIFSMSMCCRTRKTKVPGGKA
ncbi:hypothetical protein M3Y97_00973600 [Aphelenchoides bicaudatus]|nr:hypothetical protein M3Y97_00973600 [Aphelenchoides bicaudatus]